MNFKMKIKIGIDILMTLLLLLLMSYQITGQKLHEWFGVGMLVLFIAHNILNDRWYGNLFKGKYNLLRIVQTVINFGVLITILCLGYSGIVMSRHVFTFIPMNRPMATARTMHLAASYWGFVLMSVHLGLHWGMVVRLFDRFYKNYKPTVGKQMPVIWIIRIAAALIAVYGLHCFYELNIVSYMFLTNQFVFFDFEQGKVSVIAEYLAVMEFWVFTSYYAVVLIRKISIPKKHLPDI